jgi:hypothetical protein
VNPLAIKMPMMAANPAIMQLKGRKISSSTFNMNPLRL